MPGTATQISHYRVLDRLGAGGMGEVLRALDPRIGRHVAIKLLPAARADDADRQLRLLREAQAAGALNHPGIVTVHDVGLHEGQPYLVMELVEGERFTQLAGHVTLPEALRLCADVADALAVAHARDILHRDVKSDNLMRTPDGRVKVLDFGLAKLGSPAATTLDSLDGTVDAEAPATSSGKTTLPGTVSRVEAAFLDTMTEAAPPSSGGGTPMTVAGALLGTPAYMSPEQTRGEPLTPRSEVFSLGVVLYELICGKRPFAGATLDELLAAVDAARYEPPSRVASIRVPRFVEMVLARALARNPGARFATMAAMAAELRDCAQLLAPRKRGPVFIAALAIAGMAPIGLGLYFMLRHAQPSVAPPPAVDAAPAPLVPTTTIAPTAARQLTTLDGCAYTPAFVDDHTLVFDLEKGDAVDLYALDIRGGEPRALTTAAATWEWRAAPGRRAGEVLYLLTSMDDADPSFVVTLDVATGAETSRFEVFSAGAAVAGDAIYYTADDGTRVRRRRGDVDDVWLAMPPELGAQQVAASPRGDKLALVAVRAGSTSSVCVADVASPRTDACLDRAVTGARPAFTTDGAALIYAAADGVRRHDLATRDDRELIAGVVAAGGLAVSPDGRALAWSDCRTTSSLVRFSDDATASAPLVAERGVASPALDARGGLAWIRKGGAGGIAYRAPDGAIRQLAEPALGEPSFPSIDATGDDLAFVASGKVKGIFVATTDAARAPVQVTIGNDERPVWTNDGRIVFTRYDERNVAHVWIVDAEGGDPRRALAASRSVHGVDRATGDVLVLGDHRAFWWSPATGKERPGPALPGGLQVFGLAIAPRGGWLLVQTGSLGQTMWRARLDGGKATPLAKLFELPADHTVGTAAIDDDGHVVATPALWRGELHVVEAPAGTRL